MTWKELLKSDSFQSKKISLKEVDDVLGKARKSLRAAEILIEKKVDESAFKEAYDAMILASRALIFSLGYKPRSVGSHSITIGFCELYFSGGFSVLVEKFKKMKQKRNYLIYGAGLSISKTEAQNAIRSAKEFVKLVEGEILKERKQKKLF